MAKAVIQAIVTGAGGGIGRAASVRLATDGSLPVVTDINGEALNETVLDALAREQRLGRIGTPEEIAHAIVFFADPRAGS